MERTAPCPARIDDLERRHDGPPPHGAVLVARLCGRHAATAQAGTAALRQHQRLAAEARLGAARRRTVLTMQAAAHDAWLARLAATLAHHRHAAVRLAQPVALA